MHNLILISLIALGLAGCAENPNTISNNYIDDPKYQTKECTDMRQKALQYNDRVGGRIGLGMAAGILLGPFGIPLAIGAENSQNEERKVWSREVHLACSSDTLPENLK